MDTLDQSRLELLVLRAQAGDRDAFDELLSAHQQQLFGYLLKILGDQQLAEDALQSTFLQTFRKIRWLRDPSRFRGWIFRTASRIAFRIAKRYRRRNELLNMEGLEQLATDQASLDEGQPNDLVKHIPHWLDRLSHRGREVLVLHYLQGFTVPQIADILGIPLGTAKSRISYALGCVRKFANPQKETDHE